MGTIILIWLVIYIEPLFIGVYFCVKAYRDVKKSGQTFSYSTIDLLTMIMVLSCILWASVEIALSPKAGYESYFALVFLPLLWIGSLTGMFVGRGYAVVEKWGQSSPLHLVLGALCGIVGITLFFIPWFGLCFIVFSR